MNVKINSDNVLFIRELVELNGFTIQGYVNNLIERGIYRELEQHHTVESVQDFMSTLITARKADWNLLVLKPTEGLPERGSEIVAALTELHDALAAGDTSGFKQTVMTADEAAAFRDRGGKLKKLDDEPAEDYTQAQYDAAAAAVGYEVEKGRIDDALMTYYDHENDGDDPRRHVEILIDVEVCHDRGGLAAGLADEIDDLRIAIAVLDAYEKGTTRGE